MEADIARVETEKDGERMGVIRYVYDRLNTVECLVGFNLYK